MSWRRLSLHFEVLFIISDYKKDCLYSQNFLRSSSEQRQEKSNLLMPNVHTGNTNVRGALGTVDLRIRVAHFVRK